MIFLLERDYWPHGTNGTIKVDGFKLGYMIERPWNRNEPDSCIPEGIYPLRKQYDESLQLHILTLDVPGRGEMKIIPSNNIQKEAPGYIVPVSKLKGEGKGSQSRLAFEKFKEMVYSVMDQNEEVLLEVRSLPDSALNLAQYEMSWMD